MHDFENIIVALKDFQPKLVSINYYDDSINYEFKLTKSKIECSIVLNDFGMTKVSGLPIKSINEKLGYVAL